MSLGQIKELLAARLGFDAETVGSKAVATMVRRAMEHAGFSEPETYAWALERDPESWERFVDQVVIPETWFFRDGAPFELAAELAGVHFRLGLGRPLRILSCPCSTGEEPYSLVWAMLHAGAQPDLFSVDAVDVSHGLLELARAAVFNAKSFRGSFPPHRESYFHRSKNNGTRRLHAAAKARVRFRQGNLIAADFLADDAPYDVIFCRNLLIYLHSEARQLALASLRRLLAEDGVLVVGHAETSFAREHGFKPTGPSGAFAFRKSKNRVAPRTNTAEGRNLRVSISASPATQRPAPFTPAASATSALAPAAPFKPLSEPDAQLEASVNSLLDTARQLGDAGQLHAALRVCSEYLQNVPDSAEGYFLLGVLHDALGRQDLAAGSFRKVLYLDPSHQEALLCLALKQEARGDHSGAALLRERAQRAQQVHKGERHE